MAPSRMSKKELHKTLVDIGYNDDQLKKLKRPDMISLLKQNTILEQENIGQQALDALKTIEVKENDNLNNINNNNDDNKDEMTSKDGGWTQYILGMFTEDEMDGKNPRVEGLRRVSEDVIGNIIEEGCDLVSSPNNDNEMRVCVKAWIIFDLGDGRIKRCEALADAYPGNCSSEFGYYLTAMADTRAKGRCFRNALKLKKVVSAEEIDSFIVRQNKENDGDPIDTTQLTALRMMTKRMKISIPKLLEFMKIKNIKNTEGSLDISLLKRGDTKKILQQLNEMSCGEQEIPENMREKENA
jgi:hypothetical protein